MRRLGIGAMVLLAACGAGSGKSASTTSSAAATSAPPTTVPRQTVQQVASIVAQYRDQIRTDFAGLPACQTMSGDALNDADDNNNHTGPLSIDVFTDSLNCQDVLIKSSTPTLLLARALGTAKPPPEVATLTHETQEAAHEASTDAHAYYACVSAAHDDDALVNCTLLPMFTISSQTMLEKLSGWDAYLGS